MKCAWPKITGTFGVLLVVLILVIQGCDGEGPVGPEGPEGAQGEQGPMYWQGEYSAATSYVYGDAVSHQGSSYVAKMVTTGHAPPNTTYWDIVAERGEQGPQGEGVWDGGNVSGQAVFDGGADFPEGTAVDFTGANVTGIEVDWNGGTVTNDVQIGAPGDGSNLDVYGSVTIRRSDGNVGGGFRNRGDLFSGGLGNNGEIEIFNSNGTLCSWFDSDDLTIRPESGDAKIELFHDGQGEAAILFDTDSRCRISEDLDIYGDVRIFPPSGGGANGNLEVAWAMEVGQDLEVADDLDVGGDVNIAGSLSKGSGSFRIDHPLDPLNKYLFHSFVESPDMMNVYNGNVTLNDKGEALVTLPDWFEALNCDFRYQLTCIGGFAPVYVAKKIEGNQFLIAGGSLGREVSWQVTGVRQDPYAQHNPIHVEEDKPSDERGQYLHPEAYARALMPGNSVKLGGEQELAGK